MQEEPPQTKLAAQPNANDVARSVRSVPQYLRAKRKAKRLYLLAKGAFRSALNLTGLVVSLIFVVLLCQEITSEQTVIQAISVPKSMADGGLTPEAAARRLQDAMSALLFEAVNSGSKNVRVSMSMDLPEIVVPTVGISLTTLANFVRTFLHLPLRTVISGEAVEFDKNASLVLRLGGREIYRSSEPVPLDRLDSLWSAAAETVLRRISPYHLALAVYDTKPDQAMEIASYLIRYYPATDENVAWAHIILGMRYGDYFHFAQAKSEFKRALAIAEKSRWAPLRWIPFSALFLRPPYYASVAQVRLGSTLLDQGEFKAAIDALNQAIWIDPTDGSARHYLGMARMRLAPKNLVVGDFDNAERLFRKAIHDYDHQGGAGIRGQARLHTFLGNALNEQGREGAEVEFKQAMRLDPSGLQTTYAYCNFLYYKKLLDGEYDLFDRNYDSCISFLQRADFFSQTLLLAGYLVQGGKNAEAIEVLRNALKRNNDNPQIHTWLATLYERKNEWDAAFQEWSKAIELAPEAATFRNGLGDAYYRKGDFSQAAQIYSTAIERNSSNALYHANRGAALKAQGTLAAAELEYQEAFKLAADSDTEHYNIGTALDDKADSANAEKAFRKAIAIDPTVASYHADLGDTLRKLEQFDAAIKEKEKVIELEPKSAHHRNRLGNVFLAKKDFAKAVEAYRRAIAIAPGHAVYHGNLASALRELEQFDAAIKENEKAIELEPAAAGHRNKLGNIYYNKNDFTNAAEAYRKAVAIEPDNSDYHDNLADALRELEQFDAAIKENERAIELDPGNAAYHDGLGHSLYMKGDFANAVEAVSKAIAIAPGYAVYHDNLASALRELEQFDAAIRENEKAIELEPENAAYHYALGVSFYRNENFAKAVEAFDKAIAIEPGNATYHANRALALQELEQFDAAIAEYEKAIDLKPKNADHHNELGNSFYKKKDFAKAAEAYRKAIGNEPGNDTYHANRALALQELEQFDAAIAEYEKAIELKPGDAARYDRLGNSFYKKGDLAKAVEAFNKAIAIDPGNAIYQDHLTAALQELQAGNRRGQ